MPSMPHDVKAVLNDQCFKSSQSNLYFFVWLCLLVMGSWMGRVQASDLNVGVNIIGQIAPGVYGQVDITNYRRPPPLIYAAPVVIYPPPPQVHYTPVYMHVPPGHAKRWSHYCGQYHACERPVYFVKPPKQKKHYKHHHHGYRHEYRHDYYGDRHHYKHEHKHRGRGRGRDHDD